METGKPPVLFALACVATWRISALPVEVSSPFVLSTETREPLSFDHLLKRAFPAVILVLIAVAGYAQARGLMSLVALSMLDGSPSSSASWAPPKREPIAPPSADAILARNAFDSVTGPLDGSTQLAKAGAPEGPREPAACPGGWVSVIVTAEDPSWSFALVGSGKGEAEMVRFGDEVTALGKVGAIHWNRVWIDKSTDPCYLELGDRPKPAAPAKPAPRARAKTPLQKQIAERVEKVGDNHYRVDRSAVDLMLRGRSSFMRSARLVQTKSGPVLRLNGSVGRSPLAELGFKAGDQIKSINGFDMSDPEKALEAYSRLSSVKSVKVEVSRKNKPVQLEYDVR